MAVKLRLTRMGKKKRPFYRIVAVDSRAPRDGKYIEKIGHYNPLPDPAEVVINEERAFYWLKQGAIPTDTVKNLLSSKGIMLKLSLMKQGHDEAKIEEELKKWEVIRLEQERKREALAAQASREKEKKDAEQEAAEAEAAKAEETPAEEQAAAQPEAEEKEAAAAPAVEEAVAEEKPAEAESTEQPTAEAKEPTEEEKPSASEEGTDSKDAG